MFKVEEYSTALGWTGTYKECKSLNEALLVSKKAAIEAIGNRYEVRTYAGVLYTTSFSFDKQRVLTEVDILSYYDAEALLEEGARYIKEAGALL
jgi:hypothetical protein